LNSAIYVVAHSLPGLVVILAGYLGVITWTCSMIGMWDTMGL